jgi:hypothetical protein
MSSLVFPSNIPGILFGVTRTPIFKTSVQEAVSGKESRFSFMQYPRVKFNLQYELLRDDYNQTNYCIWSQDLDAGGSWTKTNNGTGVPPVITPNYSQAPDGTFTADRVFFNRGAGTTSSDFSRIYSNIVTALGGQSTTSSIWMKTNDGTTRNILLEVDQNVASRLFSVTPNWQRFSFSVNSANAFAIIDLYLIGSLEPSSTADISMWGGQIETGQNATTYIPTTSVPSGGSELRAIDGLFEAMQGQFDTFLYQDPDFNTVTAEQFGTGDGATSAFQLTAKFQKTGGPGWPNIIQNFNGAPVIYRNDWQGNQLLYSVPRTNYAIQSENLNTTWTFTNANPTGPVTSPRGDASAYLINETTANAQHYAYEQPLSSIGNATVTASCWVKASTTSWCYLQLTETTGNQSAYYYFNLSGAGSLGSAVSTGPNWSTPSAGITAYPNGWYRIFIVSTKSATSSNIQMILGTAQANATPTYAGTVGHGIYLWGAQIELNSLMSAYFPTAYIPTTTAAVGVTDYTLGATGIITLAVAPVTGALMTWTGSFFYRCRFTTDTLDFVKHMYKWWQLDSLEFISVKL